MDARRDTVSFAVTTRCRIDDFQTYTCSNLFFDSVSLSSFIFPSTYRSDRFGCVLWNLNADIMPTNTRSGNSLVALDLNIKQRARLPSIEILVGT